MSARIEAHGVIPQQAVATRILPVMIWAAIGAGFLLLVAYIWGSWILSPDFKPAPMGSDPVPENMKLALNAMQIGMTLVGLFTLWHFVARPLLNGRGFTADAMLVINSFLLYWTDPMVNYANHTLFYNGYAFNMGNWGNFIPGWSYPNEQNIAEPLLWMGWFYVTFVLYVAMFGCWALRQFQLRFPQRNLGWGLAALFLAICVFDLAIEVGIFEGLGFATYSGVIGSMSLFPGTVHQVPLYEGPIIAFVCIGFTCLRFFKDDKGLTFVERGLDRLQWSATNKKWLSFLALAGFLQFFFTFGYYLPYNLFSLHADTSPSLPSYMRTGICGEGTQYACPSREWVPVPTRYSKVVVGPDDPRLPQAVRDAQGISATGKDPYAEQLWIFPMSKRN